MKILLTGGNGFIGKNLINYIKEWKRDWIVFSPNSNTYDLTKPIDAIDLVINEFPDVIWHGAAVCGGIGANMGAPYEYCYKNALMGQNLINACLLYHKPKLFINMGSVCSYPEVPPNIPFLERDIFAGSPESTNAPYGEAKRYVMMLGEAAASKGLNFHTLMMTNAYGKYDHFDEEKSHVIPALIKKIDKAKREGTELHVWGTGNATRDFIYAEDAAAGIVRTIDVLLKGMSPLNNQKRINLGTGVETPIRTLVDYLTLIMDYRGHIIWDKTKPDGQPSRVLSTALMENYANWKPVVSLAEGLRKTVEYYRSIR